MNESDLEGDLHGEFDRGLDGEIDRQLRQAFASPSPDALLAMAADAVGVRPRAPVWPWLVAAAALLVVAVLLASWPRPRGPEGHDGHQLGALWVAAYGDAVAQGLGRGSPAGAGPGGMSCCQPSFDLPCGSGERSPCRLELAVDSAVSWLGRYSGLPTGGGLTLLAEAQGSPVCVCVVPAAQDPRVELPAGSDLHLGRRVIGEFVLYSLCKLTSSPGSQSVSQSVSTAALDSFVLTQP